MTFESTRHMALRYRSVTVGTAPMEYRHDLDGCWRLSSSEALGAYPERIFDCLIYGATAYPERTLVARRGADGQWQRISYGEMLQRMRVLGQALLDRGLTPERPLLILSGNDLEHLQLGLAAMYAGAAYCPVSPAYALLANNPSKLAYIVDKLTPGLVYASDGNAYARAILQVVPEHVELVVASGEVAGRQATSFSSLLATELRNVDERAAAIGADDIAKFLFTSGSTKLPKAVPCTHRMLCSNQQMLRQTLPFFAEEPPVLLDWLPWNHTFGGSHNVGIALYNGGSYYIDDGKPTDKDFAATLQNLREIAPTVYFNVPKGWEMLTEALEEDDALRENFFARVKLFFFAGAGLSQAAWDRLERVSEQHCGERIRIMAGLGMTETSPSCTFTTGPLMMAGYVGQPAPGVEVKLVPTDGKLEARFRGPHVMAGYWRDPALTAGAFDEEGYYCSGDALRFVNPDEPSLGLMFDGRITEDFKLSSGTFVSVGPLRARVISEGAPYIQDVVVSGLNRDDIGVMIFPRLEHCSRLAGLSPTTSAAEVLGSAAVHSYFTCLLDQLNRDVTGSATRIARMCLLDEPPSIDDGEITDKGSINQRMVLNRRSQTVDALYNGSHPLLILPQPSVCG